MIKVYEVSRKYIMLFMHNNRYLPLTGLLTLLQWTWTIQPAPIVHREILKYFRNISRNNSWNISRQKKSWNFTSLYLLSPCTVGPRSRMRDWKRTGSVEIEKFLGLLSMIGVLKKPLIAQCWLKNPLYSTPLFGSVISRNRFQLLLSMLHFNDNTHDPLRDKLFKLRPAVDHLFEHFQLL